MASRPPDRLKVAPAFWQGLDAVGLTPTAVLRHSRLPASLAADARAQVTTAQYFALWRSLEALSPAPDVGMRLIVGMEPGTLPPAFLAAYYARDLREALTRVARFKALCSPEEMILEEDGASATISLAWPFAGEDARRRSSTLPSPRSWSSVAAARVGSSARSTSNSRARAATSPGSRTTSAVPWSRARVGTP